MGTNNTPGISVANEEVNHEMDGKYLSFWIDGQLYAVPIVDVMQIVKVQEIVPVPSYPYYAKGIVNLRGIIIPIIDARLRLDKPEAELSDKSCIVILVVHDSYFGLLVDEVFEVGPIDEETITAPPERGDQSTARYLSAVARSKGNIVLLLKAAEILGVEELQALLIAAQ